MFELKIGKRLSFILLILTGIFIFYVSSLSYPPNPLERKDIIPFVYHLGIFFIFSILVFLSLESKLKYWFFVFIFSGVYAAFDEVHQYFVPNRAPSFFDFFTDLTGVGLGILFIMLINPLYKRSS